MDLKYANSSCIFGIYIMILNFNFNNSFVDIWCQIYNYNNNNNNTAFRYALHNISPKALTNTNIYTKMYSKQVKQIFTDSVY